VILALELLGRGQPELLEKSELHVYGGPLDSVSRELLLNSPVQQCMRHFGRIEADEISGLSGRVQILHKMRSADVLLLLHGEDAMCSEYIPSKLYEYLWMQRPILATVCGNQQMVDILLSQGHVAIFSEQNRVDRVDTASRLATALMPLFYLWQKQGLADNGQSSSFTTKASTSQLIAWTNQLSGSLEETQFGH
jgi:hypothetical protein